MAEEKKCIRKRTTMYALSFEVSFKTKCNEIHQSKLRQTLNRMKLATATNYANGQRS